MATADYLCQIIGDGKTPETAFRPALADVLQPVLGTPAFPSWNVIEEVVTDASGKPISPTCKIRVADNTHAALLISNPLISPIT